jgi:glutaredoxin-like YruB-family protein
VERGDLMKKVIVYTAPGCPYCLMLKNFLKSNNVEFKEIDVSLNPEIIDELVSKTGQIGVPVTEIDGEIVVGYDVIKLKKLLSI